jgi:hypothetical protein
LGTIFQFDEVDLLNRIARQIRTPSAHARRARAKRPRAIVTIPSNDAQPSNNAALIGGIVGGVVALLLIF